MSRIFVTGATGTVGAQVVTALAGTPDVRVAAASRQAGKAAAGVHPVRFDYGDPATFSQADGHDALFLLGPPLNPGLFELMKPFAEYLAGLDAPPHVVYVSAYGMEALTELPYHKDMEQWLGGSGLRTTILRPGFFATNFGNYEREGIEQRGMIYNPAGDGVTAFVDPSDIGRAAASILTQPEAHVGEVYILTGPRAYSMYDVATEIGKIMRKEITYPAPSNEQYRDTLLAAGTPPFIADYMIPVYNLIRHGKVVEIHDDLPRLLGRPATDARVVLKRDFA